MLLSYKRVWCLMVSMLAFQAKGEGSNPFTRSKSNTSINQIDISLI